MINTANEKITQPYLYPCPTHCTSTGGCVNCRIINSFECKCNNIEQYGLCKQCESVFYKHVLN